MKKVKKPSVFKLYSGYFSRHYDYEIYRPGLAYISMPGKKDDLPRKKCLTLGNTFFHTSINKLDLMYVDIKWDPKLKRYIFVKTTDNSCDGAFVYKKRRRKEATNYILIYGGMTKKGQFI